MSNVHASHVLCPFQHPQVRLSELEASCRYICTLGLTITDSASKLNDLTAMHQQMAASLEDVQVKISGCKSGI